MRVCVSYALLMSLSFFKIVAKRLPFIIIDILNMVSNLILSERERTVFRDVIPFKIIAT